MQRLISILISISLLLGGGLPAAAADQYRPPPDLQRRFDAVNQRGPLRTFFENLPIVSLFTDNPEKVKRVIEGDRKRWELERQFHSGRFRMDPAERQRRLHEIAKPEVELEKREIFRAFDTAVLAAPFAVKSLNGIRWLFKPTAESLITRGEAAAFRDFLPQIENIISQKYGGRISGGVIEKLGQGTFGDTFKVTVRIEQPGDYFVTRTAVIKVPGGERGYSPTSVIMLERDRQALIIATENNIEGFPAYLGELRAPNGNFVGVVTEYDSGVPVLDYIQTHVELRKDLQQKLIDFLENLEAKGLVVWDSNVNNFHFHPETGKLILIDPSSAVPAEQFRGHTLLEALKLIE